MSGDPLIIHIERLTQNAYKKGTTSPNTLIEKW
jgi:hypothetical protein